jgi:hypothetical protein
VEVDAMLSGREAKVKKGVVGRWEDSKRRRGRSDGKRLAARMKREMIKTVVVVVMAVRRGIALHL